jgi:hypothetical protein
MCVSTPSARIVLVVLCGSSHVLICEQGVFSTSNVSFSRSLSFAKPRTTWSTCKIGKHSARERQYATIHPLVGCFGCRAVQGIWRCRTSSGQALYFSRWFAGKDSIALRHHSCSSLVQRVASSFAVWMCNSSPWSPIPPNCRQFLLLYTSFASSCKEDIKIIKTLFSKATVIFFSFLFLSYTLGKQDPPRHDHTLL